MNLDPAVKSQKMETLLLNIYSHRVFLYDVVMTRSQFEYFSTRVVHTGIFVIPTVCDLIGTTISGIGLLYVPASVWQMLRGAIIIFAGILSVIKNLQFY